MGGPVCTDEQCKQNNLDLLHFITSNLTDRGIVYWLDFGGLLGVIREGDMIAGDDDFDICASTSEFHKIMEYFDELNDDDEAPYMVRENRSNSKCGDGKDGLGTLLLYQIRPKDEDNGALLDLFFFDERKNGVLLSRWTSLDDTHVDTIFPVKPFVVMAWGFSVNIPNKPKERLIEKYGEDYMTPKNDKKTIMVRADRAAHVAQRCVEIGGGRDNILSNIMTCCGAAFVASRAPVYIIAPTALFYVKQWNTLND